MRGIYFVNQVNVKLVDFSQFYKICNYVIEFILFSKVQKIQEHGESFRTISEDTVSAHFKFYESTSHMMSKDKSSWQSSIKKVNAAVFTFFWSKKIRGVSSSFLQPKLWLV